MAKRNVATVAAEEAAEVVKEETAAEVVESTAEEEKAEPATVAAEPAAEAAATEEPKEAETEEQVKMVYIGPSIPRSGLCFAQILTGTEESIEGFIAARSERYPEIRHLMVKPEDVSAAVKQVETKGNILNKYYQDMAAKARSRK